MFDPFRFLRAVMKRSRREGGTKYCEEMDEATMRRMKFLLFQFDPKLATRAGDNEAVFLTIYPKSFETNRAE